LIFFYFETKNLITNKHGFTVRNFATETLIKAKYGFVVRNAPCVAIRYT